MATTSAPSRLRVTCHAGDSEPAAMATNHLLLLLLAAAAFILLPSTTAVEYCCGKRALEPFPCGPQPCPVGSSFSRDCVMVISFGFRRQGAGVRDYPVKVSGVEVVRGEPATFKISASTGNTIYLLRWAQRLTELASCFTCELQIRASCDSECIAASGGFSVLIHLAGKL